EKNLEREQEEDVEEEEEEEEEIHDEDEDEYETDSSEEEMHVHVMIQPFYVQKTERDTIVEHKRLEAEEQAYKELAKRKLEMRKIETKQIVVEELRKDEEIQKNMVLEDVETDDETNEAEDYEVWRTREIARIKRERDSREAMLRARVVAVGSLFPGLVFTKAPAHEHMPKTYENPQILIVEEGRNVPLIRRQIEDSGANVILVEKSISMDSFLLKYPEVTVVTDMKHRLHRFPTFLSTCESFKSHAIVLSGSSTYELKAMKGFLKSGFNRLRNKVLSSAFYMMKFPPSVMIPSPKMDWKVEEISVWEDEVSTLIAFALQHSPNPCPGFHVSFLHKESFRKLRKRLMMSEEQYIGSLSRCDRWEAKGGKNGDVFAKTKDKRFIVKEINKTEYESFALFGPKYFEYWSDPNKKTCLTKIFGMYEVKFLRTYCGISRFLFLGISC
ncbi:unnamed protein product, partial [Arabidopsis halleri]